MKENAAPRMATFVAPDPPTAGEARAVRIAAGDLGDSRLAVLSTDIDVDWAAQASEAPTRVSSASDRCGACKSMRKPPCSQRQWVIVI